MPSGWLPDGDDQIPHAVCKAGFDKLKTLGIDVDYYEISEAFRAMLAAAPDAPSAEPVAWRLIDDDDCEYNSVDRFSCGRSGGEPLYALPPDAAAEIARLQTSWNAQCESADKLFELNAQQAERIAELESSLEIEKGQCELREEENRILFARMEAQAAALAKAREALKVAVDTDQLQGGLWEDRAIEAIAAIDALGQPEGEKGGA